MRRDRLFFLLISCTVTVLVVACIAICCSGKSNPPPTLPTDVCKVCRQKCVTVQGYCPDCLAAQQPTLPPLENKETLAP